MAAVTIDEFKVFADLPEVTEMETPRIVMFLGMAEADYLVIQGKPWEVDSAGDPIYPGSSKRIICEMVQFLLSGQVPEGPTINGYPMTVVSGIQRYVRVR